MKILQDLTRTDPLTSVANRRHFMDRAAQEVGRAQRYGRKLPIVMLDIDHFKSCNDVHGHAAGDSFLVALSKLCQSYLRTDSGLFSQLSGEEFACLLPETGVDGARAFAERLRVAISQMSVDIGHASLTLTCSFGVAEWHGGEDMIDNALRRADDALYEAKSAGRNRVSINDGRNRAGAQRLPGAATM